jgi:hypothetical protein
MLVTKSPTEPGAAADRALCGVAPGLLHLFRIVGAAFLVPGVVGRELPPAFCGARCVWRSGRGGPGGLALVLGGHPFSRISLWVFNVRGMLDLLCVLLRPSPRCIVEDKWGNIWQIAVRPAT